MGLVLHVVPTKTAPERDDHAPVTIDPFPWSLPLQLSGAGLDDADLDVDVVDADGQLIATLGIEEAEAFACAVNGWCRMIGHMRAAIGAVDAVEAHLPESLKSLYAPATQGYDRAKGSIWAALDAAGVAPQTGGGLTARAQLGDVIDLGAFYVVEDAHLEDDDVWRVSGRQLTPDGRYDPEGTTTSFLQGHGDGHLPRVKVLGKMQRLFVRLG